MREFGEALEGHYEPGLGAGIDPGMALTPFPSSIGIEPTTF